MALRFKRVKANNRKFCLDKDLVQVLLKKMNNQNVGDISEGKGYTRITTTTNDSNRVIFYAHPFFQGRRWYDWAYVHFEEINATGDAIENYYPAKILGFVKLNGITEAVI